MLKRFIFCQNNSSNSSLLQPIRLYFSSNKPTYYDILNLKQDCTNKDIRNSFLKLSKLCHPDVRGNNSTKNKEDYLKIMEAYQVLSKTDSRRSYDLTLETMRSHLNGNTGHNMYHSTTRETWKVTPDINPNPEPYYGVKGISKISNMTIVGVLLFLATVGTIFEFYLVRNSMTFRRDLLDEQSREAGVQHANVRADAEKYGNERQLERLTEKLLQRRKTGG